MAFVYGRVIRFQETDAAGVVYFANLLSMCHEAYEASLAEFGIDLRQFFSSGGEMAVPIAHAAVDFYQPLYCGEAIAITLTPRQLSPQSFEITYTITPQITTNQNSDMASAMPPTKPLVQALTRHVCISPRDRRRQVLSAELVDWIEGLESPEEPAVADELEAADD
jgi:1,4-dihydroxy-2-naphthoyl-CoA hydrolase